MQLKAHESRSRGGRRPALAALTVLTISFVGAVTYGAASAAGPASSPSSGSAARTALGVTAASEPGDTIPVDTTDGTGSEASPTPPTGLGDDPDLDALAESCFEGELLDCDHLFLQAPTGSPYEDYGDTCGGRQPAGTEEWCALAGHTFEPQPPDGLGDDATLNTLAERCYEGDLQACDDLYSQSDSSSPYHVYGDTCAGRQPENTGHYCTDLAPIATTPVSSEPASTAEPTTPETAPPSTAPARRPATGRPRRRR